MAVGEAKTAEARETEDVEISSEMRIRPASGEVPLHLPEKQEVIDQQNKGSVVGSVKRFLEDPESAPDTARLLAMDPEIQDLYAQKQSLQVVSGGRQDRPVAGQKPARDRPDIKCQRRRSSLELPANRRPPSPAAPAH